MKRFTHAASLLLWLMCASGHADQPASAQVPGTSETVVNQDGSRIRLQALAAAAGNDKVALTFAAAYAGRGENAFREIFTQTDLDTEEDEDAPRLIRLIDVDADGYHDLETTGNCGAGPNCVHTVYRFDPNNRVFYRFFDSGYFDAWVMDGHLVESGRASCCAWEFHAYPLVPGKRLAVSDKMAFSVDVSWLDTTDGGGDATQVSCTFTRSNDGQVIRPPGKRWLSICQHYGEAYHLVTPREARAAAKATATQE